ncbi:OB-fold putative lipoprotein [Scandinavium sp. H11S7]|uniref:OB-fold putative lipoprotein n=1 Tax=Scandinavium hiltneri TaxID=2926519 RepID=A0ABT2E515_9ENTR|nr:OB-fold putative lipoprotein [Scandinavium hiltneri]MCS2162959.1 OB-fold putative lipoprotein [Scandinavium hiltneri]
MKKLIKWIFYIFIGFMVLGYFASKNDKSTTSTSSSTAETQESAPQQEVFSTTARQLFKAYDENEVATDENMKGKIVAVKGVVESIDKDFTDSIIIGFQTDNQFMPARMEMKDSEKPTAIALKKGQQVTVICERMSRVMGSPSGRDCVFAK